MNALPINGLSDPVVSRFGVHLIQVIERRAGDARRQAAARAGAQRAARAEVRGGLRRLARELRARAYVEMREPPLLSAPWREAHRRASASASTSWPTSAVIDAIVDAIDPQPGRGAGRDRPRPRRDDRPAARALRRLTVIELDRDLAARLRQRPGLDVIEADVLTVDFAALAAAARPAAARGRQPALQHLHADPVPPARRGRPRGRPALHAAEGGGRAHGGRARAARTTAA